MLNCQVLTERLLQIKQSIYLLKMSWKSWKHLIKVIFIGKNDFEEDGTQNYLVFEPMYKYFKIISGVGNGRYIYYWQSKGLSDERIDSITASNYSVTPFLDYHGTKTRLEFSGSCLKQDKATLNHEKIVNIYVMR